MTAMLSAVKLLQAVYAGDTTIGSRQRRSASVSLIPPAVGHTRFGCRGVVGGVTVGGGVVSLPVTTPTSDLMPLQTQLRTVRTIQPFEK